MILNPRVKHPKWLPAEEFNAIYRRVPRLTVELLVRTPDGIVFTKRSSKSIKSAIGKWHIPGGTVFFGESLTDAVKRVALDELGVEVSVGKQVGYIEYPMMSKAGYQGWPVGIVFEVIIASGEMSGSEQGEEIGVFKELPENILEDQAKFLKSHF